MRAVVLPRFGDPGVFTCEEIARPVPSEDQMLLRVAACGVCGHDLLNRAGHFPHTRLPAVLGHEIAGTVVEVGRLVSRYKPGDRVAVIQRISCGVCHACREGRENTCMAGPGFYGEGISGGYGEYVVASERNAVPVPDGIPLSTAAVLSCALGTGYHALRRAALRLADTVVVTGASGGVGLHTLKLARLMGLRAIAVTSSAGKADIVKNAGAADVIVSADMSFHREVKALTDGRGADGVIEIAGTPTFPSSMRCLRNGGRLVMVGNVAPGNAALNPAMSILKEIDIIGSAHATVSDLEAVIRLVADGAIMPEIAATLPLERAGEAHSLMEQRATSGRVVLLHESTGQGG